MTFESYETAIVSRYLEESHLMAHFDDGGVVADPEVANKIKTTTINKNENEPPQMVALIVKNSKKISFDFVWEVLSEVFGKSFDDAMQISLIAHLTGKALIEVYPKAKAERKLKKVAAKNQQALEAERIGEALEIEVKEM